MDPSPFAAKVRALSRMRAIEMSGEIDGSQSDQLMALFNQVVIQKPSAVLLDFTEIGYINSKGIAAIVAMLTRAQLAQVRLLACGLSEHYREIFQITRLSDFIEIYSDQATAMNSVK
ncbi:MAG: STAS domain-containing protein [Chloroflexi bacterium]|nr:STAS domain-containing protein [Chloroflexota bacterium]